MMTSNGFRCVALGLTCAILPVMGCAQAPANTSGGLFSWFRSKPLSERERLRQEREQASKKLDDAGSLHLKYALWREQVGDLADARQSYQIVLTENPKSLEAKLGLAKMAQLSGRTAEAEKAFQEALQSRQGDPQALNALGQFYASQKQWSKAIPLLEEAADAAAQDPSFRYHLAVALAQSGDIDAAFPHFQQSLGEAEAHYNIGYILFEKGHKELARPRFEQAIALNPSLKQAHLLLAELNGQIQPTVMAAAPASSFPARGNSIRQATHEQPTFTPETRMSQPPAMPSQPVTQPSQPAANASLPKLEPAMWTPRQHALEATTLAPVTPTPTTNPAPPVTRPEPPAFRPTRQERIAAENELSDPNYLPPYRPESSTATNAATATVDTPAITPAQREQWENQSRAGSNP